VICDLGDVVTVPFPFVEVAALKRRPAVVLSNRAFNEDNRHSICAMITAGSRSRWARDVSIGAWAKAGLSRPCVIRWKIFTLPNENILKRLGTLAVDDRRAAQTAAAEIFASSRGSP
jgi:mRNA interferase MazF